MYIYIYVYIHMCVISIDIYILINIERERENEKETIYIYTYIQNNVCIMVIENKISFGFLILPSGEFLTLMENHHLNRENSELNRPWLRYSYHCNGYHDLSGEMFVLTYYIFTPILRIAMYYHVLLFYSYIIFLLLHTVLLLLWLFILSPIEWVVKNCITAYNNSSLNSGELVIISNYIIPYGRTKGKKN